ncbi:carbohydrate kinase family protein [Mariniblastus fucicola]|uniref:2-dehydro-3-deoxygluconokinase n=1 Tax=Mariniblastus fucicola TaxID=980251 RepID=A0A5B9P8I3_9BACT|nr:carbohydrate kinase [Mariniblastus fucicola]QEG22664.1 2-dehydro-3-deoxygluconokinase [Mariniblastus fucicola]
MLVVAGETIVDLIEVSDRKGQFQAFTGGGPYNVAKGAAKMEVKTGYLSPVSTDSFGDDFVAEMEELNVIALSPRSNAPSGLAIVKKDATGHPSYSFYRERTADRDIDLQRVKAAMPSAAKAFYIGGLAIAHGQDADIWAEFLNDVACPVFVDPNIRPTFIKDRESFLQRLAKIYDASRIVKLSDEDIEWIAPEVHPHDYLVEVMDKHDVALGLLTMGAKGAHAITKSGGDVFVAAPVVETVDTVGAGDCFSAASLASLLCKNSIDSIPTNEVLAEVLNYAVTAAAINCMRSGANAPTHAEITHALSTSSFTP